MPRTKMTRPPKEPLIKFIIGSDSVGDSVLPVSYCLTDKALEVIGRLKMLNPFLLIVVAERRIIEESETSDPQYHYHEVSRQLVPLRQGLAYIRFPKAAEYEIRGVVVNANDQKYGTLHKAFIKKDRLIKFSYWDGFKKFKDPNRFHQFGNAQLVVNVGKEFFAKEPARWEKIWVNLLFEGQAVDQCHFRRRRIFAYTLQIPLLVIWFVGTVFFRLGSLIIGTILGQRNMNYRAVWDLWNEDFTEVLGASGSMANSIFLSKKDGSPRVLTWQLYPLIAIPFIVASFLGYYTTENGGTTVGFIPSWDNAYIGLWWYIYFVLGIYALELLILGLAFISGPVFAVLGSVLSAVWPAQPTKDETIQSELNELKYLTCSQRMGTVPSLDAVPEQYRTIRLKLQNFKAKVCRPYQRSSYFGG